MELLKDLKWRYAVKKFDANKKVSEENLRKILEAGNLTATSLGMQAYRMVVVKDREILKKLTEVSWGEQLKAASHVIVLAICTKIDTDFIKQAIALTKKTRPALEEQKLEMFEKMISGYMQTLEEKGEKQEWATRQTYIVMGTLLAACAQLRIDCCPMEGIQKEKYDEILGLTAKNLKTVFALPIGYRSEDDHHQHMAKIRRPLEEMLLEI